MPEPEKKLTEHEFLRPPATPEPIPVHLSDQEHLGQVVTQIAEIGRELYDKNPPFNPETEAPPTELRVNDQIGPETMAAKHGDLISRLAAIKTRYEDEKDNFMLEERARLDGIMNRLEQLLGDESKLRGLFTHPDYQAFLQNPQFLAMMDNTTPAMYDWSEVGGQLKVEAAGYPGWGKLVNHCQYGPHYIASGHDPAYLLLNIWRNNQVQGRARAIQSFQEISPIQDPEEFIFALRHNLARKGTGVLWDQLDQATFNSRGKDKKTLTERAEHQERCAATLSMLEAALSPQENQEFVTSLGQPLV